jgi:hypothetical protein
MWCDVWCGVVCGVWWLVGEGVYCDLALDPHTSTQKKHYNTRSSS